MSKKNSVDPLSEIVPPPELCKILPAAAWRDTALIWKFDGRGEDPRVFRRFCPKPDGTFLKRDDGIPAPTLEEIMPYINSRIEGMGAAPGACHIGIWWNGGGYDEFRTIEAPTLVECAIRVWMFFQWNSNQGV